MRRLGWGELSAEVRGAIEARTGLVTGAVSATEGRNSEIALFVRADGAPVFVKGRRTDHPSVVTQQREALVNPHVAHLSSRLLWQEQVDGWNLLAFEYVRGRHADYSPGSADLPKVVDVIQDLHRTPCPTGLPLKRAERRWAEHLPDVGAVDLLAGEHLLHTDLNPLNVLIGADGARLVDWAWPTRGAGWIDPAVLVVRLISAGHSPAEAEGWAARSVAWRTAPEDGVDAFAVAHARLWEEIAAADPRPFKWRMAGAARRWARYRG
jgi:hypothetical protein